MRRVTKRRITKISPLLILLASMDALAVTPTTWTTTYDTNLYGSGGTIKFNDWAIRDLLAWGQ